MEQGERMPRPDDYAAVYEALYQRGYHSNLRLTHAEPLLRAIEKEPKLNSSIRSVLDIGCSHGAAVQRLWRMGKIASGVDVAATAVARAAAERQADSTHACVEACFRQGSALALPWPPRSFDAVISSDVLEHLAPSHVPRAAAEIRRVARRWALLSIGSRPELNSNHLHKLQREAWGNGSAHRASRRRPSDRAQTAPPLPATLKDQHHPIMQGLHLSVRPFRWWRQVFERRGFDVRLAVSGENGWPHTLWLEVPGK